MNELGTKSKTAKKMMEFAGMLNGQTENKPIQELKKDKAIKKYSTNLDKNEKLHNALEKIKNADKELIEEFDNTLMDGLD
jgi:hypothetical protein